jgi:hypothetical protein
MMQDTMFGGRNNFDDIDEEDDEDEGEIEVIIKNTMKKEKETPSLDDLLDKINKSGMSSLSQAEKNLLKQYSN